MNRKPSLVKIVTTAMNRLNIETLEALRLGKYPDCLEMENVDIFPLEVIKKQDTGYPRVPKVKYAFTKGASVYYLVLHRNKGNELPAWAVGLADGSEIRPVVEHDHSETIYWFNYLTLQILESRLVGLCQDVFDPGYDGYAISVLRQEINEAKKKLKKAESFLPK